MQVLHICSEMFPLLRTGGLADVIGALPATQVADGVDTRVLLPALPDIRRGATGAQVVSRRDTLTGHIALLFGHYSGVGIYLIDTPHLCGHPRGSYHDTNLFAYTGDVLRFALLRRVGAKMVNELDPFWRPDMVHAHDWHVGPAPTYLAARGRPVESIFTVYNLAYQGMFYARRMNGVQLPWSFFNIHGLEFNGQISLLKVGLYYAGHIMAVSPAYVHEITEPQFTYGMKGLLQQRHHEERLSGVLNGVDKRIWSPGTDLLLVSRYTHDTLEGKAEDKHQLQITTGLKVDDKVPLFTVVSRLAGQKGLDLVLEALPDLLEQGRQLALLGAGDPVLQEGFLAAAAEYPSQVGVQIGYHEAFSHRVMGNADVILMPNRFEPRGLAQLYGLKYGTLPLARRTGGLADTVFNCSLENLIDDIASGSVFEDNNAWSLLRAIRHAFVLWLRPSPWRFMQRQAMAMDFS